MNKLYEYYRLTIKKNVNGIHHSAADLFYLSKSAVDIIWTRYKLNSSYIVTIQADITKGRA